MMRNHGILVTILSISLAIAANDLIRSIAGTHLTSVGEKCFAGDYEGLVPFEPWLGGTFVCIMNTLFYGLRTVPEGMFAWGSITALYFPVAILVMVESTKLGVKGILKYPIGIFVLAQYIAVSVAFPLVWVPMYFLWGRGSTHGFTQVHATFVDAAGLYFVMISMAFFVLNTQSYAWTFTASFLGGPFFPIVYVVSFFLPGNSSDPATSSNLIVKSYQAATFASFMLWVFSLFILFRNYPDADSMLGALWTKTNYSVKIINLDWFVWFLSILLIVAEKSPMDGVKAILMLPLIGPGASLSLMLARQEQSMADALSKTSKTE